MTKSCEKHSAIPVVCNIILLTTKVPSWDLHLLINGRILHWTAHNYAHLAHTVEQSFTSQFLKQFQTPLPSSFAIFVHNFMYSTITVCKTYIYMINHV